MKKNMLKTILLTSILTFRVLANDAFYCSEQISGDNGAFDNKIPSQICIYPNKKEITIHYKKYQNCSSTSLIENCALLVPTNEVSRFQIISINSIAELELEESENVSVESGIMQGEQININLKDTVQKKLYSVKARRSLIDGHGYDFIEIPGYRNLKALYLQSNKL